MPDFQNELVEWTLADTHTFSMNVLKTKELSFISKFHDTINDTDLNYNIN